MYREILPITESLNLLGRKVSYYPMFAKALGCLKAAVFISQFYHLEGRQSDEDGWIYKTAKEIESGIGMTRYEQQSARKRLIELGLMEEVRKGVPGKMHFRFDWAAFDRLMHETHKRIQAIESVEQEMKKRTQKPKGDVSAKAKLSGAATRHVQTNGWV